MNFDPRAVAQELVNQSRQANPGNGAAAPLRSFYWTMDDIKALEPPEWVIEDLLPRRAKALIFGESGHYKTMHVVDQLCRVAHGMDYHGLSIAASYPVCFIANEDAYGLAVKRIQGWHLKYSKPGGRVIVLPANTKLDQPEDVERAIACARDAFGDLRAVFAIDTWDRSITGNPNSTEDINPALNGLDRLLAAGEATVTISHSPWSDKNRTKGAVTFWANHDARIKAEKEEGTGYGILRVIHHKNARAGLELAFEFEQFVFQHRGVDIDTLIPQRLFEYWPVQTPDRRAQNAPLGSRQKLMMRVLKKLAGQRSNGVERDLLRSHFMQELIAEHKRQHNTQLSSDHARVAFGQTLDSLKNRGLIEGEDLLFPTDGTRQPQAYERNVPPKGENVRSYVDPDAAERSVRNRTKRTNRSDGQGEGSEGMGEGNANASPRSDGLEEKLARMRARDVPPS